VRGCAGGCVEVIKESIQIYVEVYGQGQEHQCKGQNSDVVDAEAGTVLLLAANESEDTENEHHDAEGEEK